MTAWCEELVRTTQAPGVIGVTTPQAANTVRDTLGGAAVLGALDAGPDRGLA